MLKLRVTFPYNDKGLKELDELLKLLRDSTDVISETKSYKLRGGNIYHNMYVELEMDNKDNSDIGDR